MVPSISAKELSEAIKKNDSLLLVDVREPEEYDFTRLEPSQLIPLGELESRASEIDPQQSQKLIFICRSGQRSEYATEFMLNRGVENAFNLDGGLLAYSDEDPSIKKY